MINLRYHIVSITAVFLALGIGIAMGGAFLNDLTLEQIDKNVRSARAEVRDVRAENARLEAELARSRERAAQLADEGADQLFGPWLDDVPVLLVAVPGTDSGSLDRLRTALERSGAAFEGTLRATGRMALEGDAADEMADLLDAASTDPEQLYRIVAARMAEEMTVAAEPPEETPGTTTSVPATTVPATGPDGSTVVTEPATSTTTPDAEPELADAPEFIGALVEAGFFEHDAVEGGPATADLLRRRGYRYVLATSPAAELSDDAVVLPLVRALTADGAAPLVLSSAAVGDDAEEQRRSTIDVLLDEDGVRDRLSTVDDLESVSGLAATILALDDLGRDRRGHYGVGEEAQSQLPDVVAG